MKIKMLIAAAAITVTGAFATSASAAPLSPTEVTIKGDDGDYYGKVKSSDVANCEDGRKVKVFKMLGASPKPSTDLKIGSDNAELSGGAHAEWSIGNSGYKHGKFYARAGKTDYCGADTSPVIVR
jgi:hypothetical protein